MKRIWSRLPAAQGEFGLQNDSFCAVLNFRGDGTSATATLVDAKIDQEIRYASTDILAGVGVGGPLRPRPRSDIATYDKKRRRARRLCEQAWIVMGMQITPFRMFVAFALFGLLVACWQLFDSLWNDRVRLREGPVYRHERPRMFWFLIGVNCWVLVVWSVALLFLLKAANKS